MRFNTPKVWVDGEILRSGEQDFIGLNDVVASLAASLNNVRSDQIASGASIQGGLKIAGAPSGLSQSSIREGSVSAAKLDSSVHAYGGAGNDWNSAISVGTSWTTLATMTRSVTASVYQILVCPVSLQALQLSGAGQGSVELRYVMDGNTKRTVTWSPAVYDLTGPNELSSFQFVFFSVFGTTSGSHTWLIEARKVDMGVSDAVQADLCDLTVVEWR